jgi:hypothetical protein
VVERQLSCAAFGFGHHGNLLEPMKTLVPDVRGFSMLPGCGPWVQQERATEMNDALIAFIRGALPGAPS